MLELFRDVFRERLRDPFRGTLAPFSRASLSPIAIACLRLVTRRPDRPLFNVPFFLRRIADSTRFEAALPYFAIAHTSALVLASRSPLRNEEPGTDPHPARVSNGQGRTAVLEQHRDVEDHVRARIVDDRMTVDDTAGIPRREYF